MNEARVLLVEDNGPSRELTRILLETSGHFQVVAQVGNGLEAIAAARRSQPDLIILDLAMPVMNGFDALPRLREVSPKSAIIVLSMLDRQRASADALARGADLFLDKGTPDDEFASTLWALYQHIRETEGTQSPGVDGRTV